MHVNSATVACLGLSAAYQRTLVFADFRTGAVNRVRERVLSAGGKAVNAALALSHLGRDCAVCGFNGTGETGRFVAAQLATHGVRDALTSISGPTRTCTTILNLATGEVTELVEDATLPTIRQLQQLERGGRTLLRKALAGLICGTVPSGIPDDLWARFASEAQRRKLPLLIDSHANPLLLALPYEPLLAKMNLQELEKTFALRCRTESRILATAAKLTAAGAAWALITRGAQPAILVSRDGAAWRCSPPEVRVVSTTGSGDCVNAGIMHALLCKPDMLAAVRMGLGCGSAKALSCTPSEFAPAMARKLAVACRVEQIR